MTVSWLWLGLLLLNPNEVFYIRQIYDTFIQKSSLNPSCFLYKYSNDEAVIVNNIFVFWGQALVWTLKLIHRQHKDYFWLLLVHWKNVLETFPIIHTAQNKRFLHSHRNIIKWFGLFPKASQTIRIEPHWNLTNRATPADCQSSHVHMYSVQVKERTRKSNCWRQSSQLL